MKKIKNTRNAYVGTTYSTQMNAEINRVEEMILAQQARLDEIERLIKALKGE